MARAGGEAEVEAMEVELVRARRQGQSWSELMKKYAEKAGKITLQQIERDSADLEGRWRMIRVDCEKLKILSLAHSTLKAEILVLKTRITVNSVDVSGVRRKVSVNKRDIATLGKDKASTSLKKLLKKQFKSYTRELVLIEKQIREANGLTFLLQQKKAAVEGRLRFLGKMIADEEASFNASLAELEEDRRVIEAQLMAVEKKAAALKESLELETDVMGYCTTAVAMTEQVYLRRLSKLRFDGNDYVELVDTIDVNVLRSICAKSSGCGGVVLKFCVAKDELLELVATAIQQKRFVLRLDRLYELSVDKNGKCNIFELSVQEAATNGFKCDSMENNDVECNGEEEGMQKRNEEREEGSTRKKKKKIK